jgi:ABC-2 type transport system permease protein
MGLLVPVTFAGVSLMLASAVRREEILALTRNPVIRVFAEPVSVETPGGYATWRLSLLLPMVAVWALLVVSRMTRGEEESGALDVLLSISGSRVRVVVEKLAAIASALTLIGVLLTVLVLAGARVVRVEIEPVRAFLFGFNATLFALVFAAIAFVVGQFTRERRPAAGATAILLGVSFLFTSVGRVVPGYAWIARLSPLHYFELNKPLIADYPVNIGALVTMAVLSLALTVVGLALFVRRDVGAPYILVGSYFRDRPRSRALPIDSWSLRSLMRRQARGVGGAALWWAVGLGAYSMLVTMLLRQVQQNLRDLLADLLRTQPQFAPVIERFTGGGDPAFNVVFLNAIFAVLVVVVVAFAASLANRWAGDEEEGRLDVILATPHPRSRVMLTCFAAGVLGLTIVTGSILAGTTLASTLVGMPLDKGRVAAAAFGMIPIALIVASIGYLLAGWLRAHAVTGILTGLILASFALTLLAPLFSWPKALLQLSIFDQYGTPLVDGLRGGRVIAQLGVAAAVLLAAVIRFDRKDLTR